ncbi:MAG: hypothetical protein DMG68_15820 [Acidobacteria bacterium]|jgi:hypothetical protein|nr:MAG: hypothetical protein DMG68_15820 [Acidobacteriota bacterium]
MRIDQVQVAAAVAQALKQVDPQCRRSVPTSPPAENAQAAFPNTFASTPALAQRDLSISVEHRIVIYRFLDPRTGDLLEQVPPEELLKVARNIEDLLNSQQQQKLNIRG